MILRTRPFAGFFIPTQTINSRSVRHFQGLGELFRRESPEERIEQLKGIKIELSGLKNCIVLANRRRWEYAASKEAQMRLRQPGAARQRV